MIKDPHGMVWAVDLNSQLTRSLGDAGYLESLMDSLVQTRMGIALYAAVIVHDGIKIGFDQVSSNRSI